jgi:cytochrome c2
MGRFNLTDRQREAIMTFVLGLVAEPPGDKYVCRAEGRRGAIAEGRKVLDKYACAECHTLELERWTLANAAGGRGTELVGTPRVDASGKLLEDEDDAGQPLNFFTPWEPAVIDGRSWPVGGADVPVGRSQLLARHPPLGGTLARLLYPVLLARAKASGATGTESEVWGWTPPPLVHEGAKVQAAWLRDYLANPAAIRPAAALRMPRFNFSEAEIAKLVAYFAADSEEKTVGLAAGLPTGTLDPPYNAAKTAGDSGTEETPLRLARWQSAMKILTDQKTFCARCHLIGEQPGSGGGFVATAPNLEEVGHRIQPEYIRRWLANPRSILPYTTMPVNFPPASPPLGKVAGLDGSDDQLDAVVDLLIHYDRYLRRQRRP